MALAPSPFLDHDGHHGFAHDVGAAHHHHFLTLGIAVGPIDELLAARRGAGQEGIVADQDAAHVHRMEGVHVFVGINAVEHLVGVDVLGQGQLHQDAVDLGVLVVLVQEGQQGRFGDIRLLVVLNGIETEFVGGLLLGGDVADGAGVLAHQDGDQARGYIVLGLEFFHLFLQFGAYLGGHLRPFDQFSSHGSGLLYL